MEIYGEVLPLRCFSVDCSRVPFETTTCRKAATQLTDGSPPEQATIYFALYEQIFGAYSFVMQSLSNLLIAVAEQVISFNSCSFKVSQNSL